MQTKAAARLVSILLLSALWSAPTSALMITLVPPDVTPIEGESFDLDLVLDGIPDGEVVSAFEIVIGLNNSLVSFAGASFSDALGSPAVFNNPDDWDDCLTFFADEACAFTSEEFSELTVANISTLFFELFDIQDSLLNPGLYDDLGRLVLATLTFDALVAGDALFRLCPDGAYGSLVPACEVKDFMGFLIPGGELVSTTVTINERVVPIAEPGSIALIALGLLSLVLVHTRRRVSAVLR